MFLAIIGIAMKGFAQDVKIPKITKFVKPKQQINIRQGPTTSSPKLMTYNKKNGTYEWGEDRMESYYCWEGEREQGVNPARMPADGFVPVVEENAEWYHVLMVEEHYGVPNSVIHGWVSKKLCSVQPLKPFDQSYLQASNPVLNMITRTSGKYRGYSIIEGCFDGPFNCGLFVGRMEHGVGVGALVRDYYDYVPEGGISALSDSDIEKMLKIEPGVSYVYGAPGHAESREGSLPNEGIYVLNIDPDKYDGPTY